MGGNFITAKPTMNNENKHPTRITSHTVPLTELNYGWFIVSIMVISIMRITVVCNSSSFGIGVDDNHIHYTSLCLFFSIIMRLLMTCSCYPSVNVLDLHACKRKHPLWIRIVSFDSVALFLHSMHIDTQTESVGMYSECDYPYKSCLCTF